MTIEFDQLFGNLQGLIQSVQNLPHSGQHCWAWLTKRLLDLPVDAQLEAVRIYLLGKLADAERNANKIEEIKAIITAGEKALRQVTTTLPLLDITNNAGIFAYWFATNKDALAAINIWGRDRVDFNSMDRWEALCNELLLLLARHN